MTLASICSPSTCISVIFTSLPYELYRSCLLLLLKAHYATWERLQKLRDHDLDCDYVSMNSSKWHLSSMLIREAENQMERQLLIWSEYYRVLYLGDREWVREQQRDKDYCLLLCLFNHRWCFLWWIPPPTISFLFPPSFRLCVTGRKMPPCL